MVAHLNYTDTTDVMLVIVSNFVVAEAMLVLFDLCRRAGAQARHTRCCSEITV